MEFSKFLNILKKHKYALMGLPIIVMVITIFLVRKMPSQYASQSRLSVGLTAGSQTMQLAQQLFGGDNMGESKINQTFSNVTQTMQLKIVYDQVSYQLMLHDLTAPELPFRPPSKLLASLNEEARKHAVEVYTRLYNTRQPLNLADHDQDGLNEVINSMKYDFESLRDKVKVYRVENSDFIDVSAEAENSALSAYIVNTLCKEFIAYNSSLTQQNKLKSADFLYDLMMKKKDSLNTKTEALKNYKIQNGIMNISDQTKSLYTQIADFENKLQMAERDVEANAGAIAGINQKFSAQERQYIEAKLAAINQDIVATQDQLNKLNDQYIKSNFDPSLKARIDALREVYAQQINQSTDKHITNPLTNKENLVSQKLKLELELDLARNSMQTYRNAINRLNGKLSSLAPNEAVLQAMDADIAVASKEYLEILARYNQSTLQLSASNPIKVIEMAAPGKKLPSKKLIIVAFSGVLSFIVYLFILFVLFYLDDSVKVSADLVDKTDIKVLGMLPVIKSAFLDVQKLWYIDQTSPVGTEIKKLVNTTRTDIQKLSGRSAINPSTAEFKKLIRSTRFEINMAMMGARNLIVTSLVEGEGKTLFSLSMVSAYQMMNKKILLIDGNFMNPSITEMTKPNYFIEDYLVGKTILEDMSGEGSITIMGNYGADVSLFEIVSEYDAEQKLLELKDMFDMVIIEAPALTTLNQSKEWIVVGDRVMGVFEANTTISNEMKDQILYLKSLEEKFIGWVLNKATK